MLAPAIEKLVIHFFYLLLCALLVVERINKTTTNRLSHLWQATSEKEGHYESGKILPLARKLFQN